MKRIISTVIIITLLLTACNKKNESVKNTLATELLSNPEVEVSKAAERDYGDKEIVNGRWRYIITEDGEKQSYVCYVPLFRNKIAGVYDLEDYYDEISNGSVSFNKALYQINQPKGTEQGHFAGFERPYLSKKYHYILENNVETLNVNIDETTTNLQLIAPAWYTVSSNDGNNSEDYIKIIKADVVCYTFALYEETTQIPGIKISFYGVDQNTVMQYFTLKEYGSYKTKMFNQKKLYTDYLNDSVSLTKLGSFDVTESGVKYADLKALSKGVEYYNILTVIEFDSLPEDFSYYITGTLAYDIKDSTTYEAWKKENEGKFFE